VTIEAERELYDLVQRLDGAIRDGELASATRRWLFEHVGGEATRTHEPGGERPAERSNAERLRGDRLLKATEAADYVGVHKNRIYEAAKRGDLDARRVGRLVRFHDRRPRRLDEATVMKKKPNGNYEVRVRVGGHRRGATFRTLKQAQE
jgi:excisionase family DNA binding protein